MSGVVKISNIHEKEVKYSKKILVFFDLLGFKNLIDNNLETPDKVKSILNDVYHYSKGQSYDFQLINFSDSIILIFESESNDKDISFTNYINNILGAINRVQLNLLLNHKVAIRGAAVLGDIYYNEKENIIFGPALNTAAGLEKDAVYPRIIIDKSIVDKLDVKESEEMVFLNFTIDENNELYANPFQYLVKTPYEQKNGVINDLKKNLVEIIQEIEQWDVKEQKHRDSVLQKFRWLLNRLNEREVLDFKRAKEYFTSK